MNYLLFLFNLGKSYSVINTHKVTLLQTFPFFGNVWCKDSCLIPRFMKSVFLQKPSRPRYCVTWDVSIVLKFLKSLMPLSKLSLKLLTFKVVALLALATAPRAQTLVAMRLGKMFREQQAVVFTFDNILKTNRDGHAFSLSVEHFQDESLCAMHTLLFYIDSTKSVRKNDELIISYVTYKPVCTSTVARWLKCVLQLSGINTDIFKAHSYRGASASAAFNKGCSLNNILSTADWKSDKNFRKFYFRRSVKNNKNVSFNNAVMSCTD